MDHYISQFQEHASNLERVKQPMAELLQRTFFLQNILNPYYRAMKSECEANDYNIDKCITELHHKSINNENSIPLRGAVHRVNNNIRQPPRENPRVPFRANLNNRNIRFDRRRAPVRNLPARPVNLTNYIPLIQWRMMLHDEQVAHMNARRAATEQVPPTRAGMPTILEDPNVTPRKPTPYGMQYSPTRLQRTITSPSTSTSNYINIWGPPISRRDG